MGTEERREREKQQRRNAILDAAEKLFFNYGLGNTTMEQVAREAEFSKGTIYLYFKNKEELYLGITQRSLDLLTQMFIKASESVKTGIEKVSAIGYAYLEFSQKHRNYYDSMLYYESRAFEFTADNPCAKACETGGQQTLKILVQAIVSGIEDGTINSVLNPEATAVVLWAQTMGIIQLASLRGDHFEATHNVNMDEIIRLAFQLMLNSIKT